MNHALAAAQFFYPYFNLPGLPGGGEKGEERQGEQRAMGHAGSVYRAHRPSPMAGATK